MRILGAAIIVLLASVSGANAQSAMCPDRPATDSSNACANTRFVHSTPISPSQLPALTGDVSSSAGSASITVNKVSGVSPGTGVLTAFGNVVNATGGFTTVDGTATLTNKTLSGAVLTGGTSETYSGVVYNDLGSPYFLSYGDRAFLGSGQPAWKGFNYSAGVTTGTWVMSTLNTELRYLEKGAQLVVGSQGGAAAVYGFTRQSDSGNTASDPPPIAIAGLAYNDVVGTRGVWGTYREAHRIQGSGPGIAAEYEAVNYGSEDTYLTPYGNRYAVGEDRALSYTLGLGCGAGLTTGATRYNCTAAIYITANTLKFRSGIEILNNSIAADASNNIEAIGMAAEQAIIWRYSSGINAIGGIIRSDNSTNNLTSQRIVFEAGALRIKGVLNNEVTEHNLFSVLAPSLSSSQTGVNSFTISPQATDGTLSPGTATILASGPDTNINTIITPKGSGVFGVGYSATTATTPASFVANRIFKIRQNGVDIYVAAMNAAW